MKRRQLISGSFWYRMCAYFIHKKLYYEIPSTHSDVDVSNMKRALIANTYEHLMILF